MADTITHTDAEQNIGKRHTISFLIISFSLMIIVFISLFSFFALHMNKKGEVAITSVGKIYMSGMNEKILEHFDTTINLRLSQVENIVTHTSPEDILTGKKSISTLADEGRLREFDSLALYDKNGNFEMLYGDTVSLEDPPPFLESLSNHNQKVAVAKTNIGEKVVLLGIPAEYPMPNGNVSMALVASVSTSYINNILSLDEDETLTYSHIIRKDGSYVIHNDDNFRENYFNSIYELCSPLDGKDPKQYVSELKSAIENSEDYSAILLVGNERRHLYCSHLPHSEWYLVTIMPFGTLDEAVSDFGSYISKFLFVAIGLVLLVMAVVFMLYFRMTQRQIKQLEFMRNQAISASKAKSEFLSNMSHDIRTPMNAIVGMTAIATANINNKQQVQNCLKKITLSGKHLLGLINDILDMSKIESGKMTLSVKIVSLREIVSNIVNIIQPQIKAKQQNFDVFIHDIENENVYCDSVRLNQVLLNLLSNAVKFTPDGGSISLSLIEKPSPKGKNFLRIELYVKDSGIGMSAEFKEKIFESFAREDNKRVHKTEGSGLGMAITKYIVDAMEGEISVESEPGKGTEFHISLDFEVANISESDMVLPNWNMLVVDDDEQLCKSAAATLASIGINADWTLNGESAIEMVHERKGANNEYQIIMLDWKLPGINGIETARKLREQLAKDVPILLISAYDWAEIEDEARDAGINGFISKPLFKSTLYLGLREYAGIETSEAEDSTREFDFSGLKVLVAEDNELNWEVASELLSSQLGLDMELAENGQICLEKFQNSPVGYYDVILMDVRMPVMNGYEATKAIRKMKRADNDILIVAMTADAFSDDVKRCLECGMNAHTEKPIDVNAVGRILKKHLKK